MENDSTAAHAFNKQEPIPGYIAKELLGTGGYGEVWKSRAPGGLFKAVKIISASGSSKRASAELRSLNRIKEARHPFLLSIERIEVVAGNVVIVTELADHSLKRQFQKERAKGRAGVPREELLGYLHDAAEALDFIYDNYSLQHLDIKPENLLILGNRAKVADFGMIKNLYDRSASSIEGLTPMYAPPELFEGKPNRHSDQYSLAIVYQEMLTGSRPFDGSTAAQLAAQHLHMAPSLAALPRCDQPIIARALSKEPSQRFASCRALIDSLVEAGKSNGSNEASVSFQSRGRRVHTSIASSTQELDEQSLAIVATEAAGPMAPIPIMPLPAVEMDDQTPMEYEPVLFVGIGGTATRVFRRLRQRFYDRLGALETVPAIEMLVIDTDVKSLNRATDGNQGSTLDCNEKFPTPLRHSEDYRSAAGNILASVSRRWLFNVPYSLETDGFRPLGRLAMIDHSKRLFARLRESLVRITSDKCLEDARKATGLPFVSRQPRVFIVASTAGGTGSGMVIDIAYAVRSILAQLDLPDGNVHGVLLHSTARGPRERDRAIANTYATLAELWHYSRPGKYYPGDRGCGLPAFHGNNRTFSTCYFLDLGNELSEFQFELATDPVAEYLYTSAVTPAARFLDQCRQLEYVRWGTELTEPVIRTFGLSQLGTSNSEIPAIVSEALCRDLVYRWRDGMKSDNRQTAALLSITAALSVRDSVSGCHGLHDIEAQAAEKAVELGIDLEEMKAAAREILDHELPSGCEAHFGSLIASCDRKQDADDLARIIAAIDSTFTPGDESALNSLSAALNTRIEGRAAKMAGAICDWVFDLVDEGDGVAGAKHAAEWFKSRLRDLQATVVAAVGRLQEEALSRQHMILRRQGSSTAKKLWGRKTQSNDVDGLLRDYVTTQIEQCLGCSVTRWLRLVEARLNSELERLQVFWKDLTALSNKFDVSQSLDEVLELGGDSEAVPSHWRELLDELIDRRNDLILGLDRAIEQRLAVGSKKLRSFLNEGRPIDTQLALPLRTAARQIILAAMQDLNVSRLDSKIGNSEKSFDYQSCIQAARPGLADHATGARLLLVIPDHVDADRVRQSLVTDCKEATIVPSTDGEFIACHECELIEMRQVAARLVGNRRDFIEIARRLHTRIDVNWDDMSTGCIVDPPCLSAQESHAEMLSEVRR